MVTPVILDASRWRKRAEQMRALAQNLRDPDIKARMHRAAEDYDHLAKRARPHHPVSHATLRRVLTLRHMSPRPPMDLGRSDYSLSVKRNAKPPNSWRWEINSSIHFETVAAATKAGKAALKLLLDRFYK
jgi:hypothetical protein